MVSACFYDFIFFQLVCHVNIRYKEKKYSMSNTNTFLSKQNRYRINVNKQSYVIKESIQKPFSKHTEKGLLMYILQIKRKMTRQVLVDCSCLLFFNNFVKFLLSFMLYYCINITLHSYLSFKWLFLVYCLKIKILIKKNIHINIKYYKTYLLL